MQKFRVWQMIQYERILILDSDIVLQTNIDGVFEDPVVEVMQPKEIEGVEHLEHEAAYSEEYLMAATMELVEQGHHYPPKGPADYYKGGGYLNAGFMLLQPSQEMFEYYVSLTKVSQRCNHQLNRNENSSHLAGQWHESRRYLSLRSSVSRAGTPQLCPSNGRTHALDSFGSAVDVAFGFGRGHEAESEGRPYEVVDTARDVSMGGVLEVANGGLLAGKGDGRLSGVESVVLEEDDGMGSVDGRTFCSTAVCLADCTLSHFGHNSMPTSLQIISSETTFPPSSRLV
jgi:hypothetical protein